jgi:EAL domain-containing protein (putative c-di-GMP-specific phosphodiesterase class I)
MNSVIAERLEMQSALRAAVENEQFELLYQPKVDLMTGRIAGMEALLRVKDTDGALLLPQEFIRLAVGERADSVHWRVGDARGVRIQQVAADARTAAHAYRHQPVSPPIATL